MIRTVVTPQNTNIVLEIPKEYVGKTLEISLLALEELIQAKSGVEDITKFRGKLNLTQEQQNKFQTHLDKIKSEWNKNF